MLPSPLPDDGCFDAANFRFIRVNDSDAFKVDSFSQPPTPK
jgi:hypothetical protein